MADLNEVLDRADALITDDDDDETPAPEAKPAPAAPAPAAEDDPYDKGADTFDRAYVEKLRQEAGRYRTEAKQLRDDNGRFTSAFDGVDPAQLDTFLALPAALRDDPKGTARWMREQAEAILAESDTPDPREGEHNEDRPLTKAELDKIFAERDHAAAIERVTQTMREQVEDLGFAWDSDEASALLQIATKYDGDIGRAHQVMASWAQSAVDQYVDGKKQKADTVPPTPPSSGAGVTPPKIRNAKDASKAVSKMLADQGWK